MGSTTGTGNRHAEDEFIKDLVVALLSVNFWTLERVYALHDSLEAQGLFDMRAMASLVPQAITKRLVAAGYSRGGFPVPMMADRLAGTARKLASGGEEHLKQILASGTGRELDQFLLTLKGVGPVVVSNFKVLQGIEH